MPSVGFEPAIPAIERQQTYALDQLPEEQAAVIFSAENIFCPEIFAPLGYYAA
jgi:hypothetical protein